MADYVLVPRVATEGMLDAMARHGVKHREWCQDVHAAMLAARPPVDWTDLMAMATVAVDKTAAPHVLADADMRRTIICCMAQALREVMK